MEVKIIATGSSGNCTLIKSSDGEKILLDVGIAYKKITESAGYADYAVVTHEHGDHANLAAIKKLLDNGTEIYMTVGTAEALRLEKRHNLHTFKAGAEMKAIKLGHCKMLALKAKHDAAEPIVIQIYDGEDRILYATDTGEIPKWEGAENEFTKMLIEANYSEIALSEGEIEEWRKKRILENHNSIERIIEYFEIQKTAKPKEIHLIHISRKNGNAENFKAMLEKITDVPIYTH